VAGADDARRHVACRGKRRAARPPISHTVGQTTNGGTWMNEADPADSGRSSATTVARRVAVVTAGLCALVIMVNLGSGTASGRLGIRIVLPLGCLVSVAGNGIVTDDRAKMVLALCGALIVTAAVVLDLLGY
jgi:hypothetical protein